MTVLSAESLPVLKAVLLLTQLVHFPLAGVLAGGATVAVFLDLLGRQRRTRHYHALAVDLLRRIVPRKGVLVLLPLVVAASMLSLLLGYGPPLRSAAYGAALFVPLLCGLLLLGLYRGRLEAGERLFFFEPALALAGIALVLLPYFLLCCTEGLLVMPEKWPLLGGRPLLFLSWSATARFLEFTFLSLAATGAVVLFLGSRPPDRSVEAPEHQLARRLGAAMALLFLLAWPVAMLFGLFNLPEIALGGAVYAQAATSLATAAGAAFLLLESLRHGDGRFARAVFALALALFALWLLGGHLTRENALGELTVTGRVETPGAVPAPGKVPPAGEKEEKGREVFERVCSRCHRFDERLVGPPFNVVLPPYREDIEALKAFIRQPVKKNPEYPAMPQLGLKEAEIDAVAHYLLARVSP